MAKVYFSEKDLATMQPDEHGVLPPATYSLRGPVPQMLLVTTDRHAPYAGPRLRTVVMTPLSWGPYTKAVSVPLDDSVVVDNLSVANAQCVLAEPTRYMLRQLTICSQRLPRGLSEASVARFTLMRSMYVDVPGIADCPVNMECTVEHLEIYHGYLIAFLRVVGGSIDDSLLFCQRQDVVHLFPTNDVDSIVDAAGNTIRRVGIMGDLFLCPTYPVGPKQGWYGTFEKWMTELKDDGYLSEAEWHTVIAWYKRWLEVFAGAKTAERETLRAHLTQVCRFIADEHWDKMHAFMAKS